MNINIFPKGHWFGSDDSLFEVIAAAKTMDQTIKSQGLTALYHDNDNDDDEEELPRLLTLVDSTAVINISGSLVNGDSFWNRYMGVTGYPEIKDALIEAVNRDEIETILLSINSGGGTAEGVFDLADFIKQVDTQLKPVESMNSGAMLSAAYLLGSQARKVHATKMSESGSIGVISIHQSYAEMFKKEGIDVTVIRAGSHKALTNPYEKLSEEGKKEIQVKADYIHDQFIETVADGREMSFTNVKENMADGRTFFPEEAMRLGLIDDIISIDQLVAELNEKHSQQTEGYRVQAGDSEILNLNTSSIGEIEMANKKTKLSKEAQAKLALGVTEKGKLATSVDDNLSPGQIASKKTGDEAELALAEEAAAKLAKKPDKVEKTETELSDESNKTDFSLITHLKEKETELSTKLAESTALLSAATTELATIKSSVEGLEKTVVSICDRLAIALNQSGADFSHLTGNALVTQHAKLDAEFCKRYPVGGVVKSTVDKTEQQASTSSTRAKVQAAEI